MSKKDFIALADAIRAHNSKAHSRLPFTNSHLDTLADFCQLQNAQFKRDRWLGYIKGENGPSGGTIRR